MRAGAGWLHDEQWPSYDDWQVWRNTDARDVGCCLRLFTDLPLDEVARLERLEGAEINQAKKMLAAAATTMCRGAAAAAAAAETARKTFEERATGDALPRRTVPGGQLGGVDENGRGSGWARVWQYGEIEVVGGSYQKKH